MLEQITARQSATILVTGALSIAAGGVAGYGLAQSTEHYSRKQIHDAKVCVARLGRMATLPDACDEVASHLQTERSLANNPYLVPATEVRRKAKHEIQAQAEYGLAEANAERICGAAGGLFWLELVGFGLLPRFRKHNAGPDGESEEDTV